MHFEISPVVKCVDINQDNLTTLQQHSDTTIDVYWPTAVLESPPKAMWKWLHQ